MIDSTKLSGYPYSSYKLCGIPCKNSLAVKETQPSKVESYLRDEYMVWLTTRGYIRNVAKVLISNA